MLLLIVNNQYQGENGGIFIFDRAYTLSCGMSPPRGYHL